MARVKEVEVWHDALGQPNERRIAEQVEWWERIGWELVEREEVGWRWLPFAARGRTVLRFEKVARGADEKDQRAP